MSPSGCLQEEAIKIYISALTEVKLKSDFLVDKSVILRNTFTLITQQV